MRWMMLIPGSATSVGALLMVIASGVAAGILTACYTSPAWITVTAETQAKKETATAYPRHATWHAENEARKATGVALEAARIEAYEATQEVRNAETRATASANATYLAENPPTPSTHVTSKGERFACERLRMAFNEMKSLGTDTAYMHVSNIMSINAGGAAWFDSYDAKVALRKCN